MTFPNPPGQLYIRNFECDVWFPPVSGPSKHRIKFSYAKLPYAPSEATYLSVAKNHLPGELLTRGRLIASFLIPEYRNKRKQTPSRYDISAFSEAKTGIAVSPMASRKRFIYRTTTAFSDTCQRCDFFYFSVAVVLPGRCRSCSSCRLRVTAS